MKDNIFIFGDSISYGFSDNNLGGWVNRLRLYLDSQKENGFNVFNLSISGEISEGILNRFDHECNARFDKDERTIIIFATGINDTQNVDDSDRVSFEQFESNIKTLINQAKKFTNKILFVGLTKVDETKSTPWIKNISFFNEKIIQFDNAIEKICSKEEVSYIKMYDLLSLENLADGLHPNDKGHEKMYKQILVKIEGLLKESCL